MDINKLRKERAGLISEAKSLRDAFKGDTFTPEQKTRALEIQSRLEALDGELREAERLESLFSHSDPSDQIEERRSNPLPTDDAKNTRNGQHEFRICRAVDRILSGRDVDGIEAEVLAEYSKQTGMRFDRNQFVVPPSLRVEKRAITTEAASAGKSIQTTVSPTMIEFLRNALMLRSLGATVLADLVGNLSIPKQTAISNAGWKAEGVAFDESNPVLDQVPLTPKRVGTFVEFTRTIFRQSGLDIENMVRNDLVFAVAAAIDRAGIAGSGSGSEPAGILTLQTSQVVALGTNGAAPTWAAMVDLEGFVDTANALQGSLAYLTNPKVIGALKKTPKVAGQPIYLMNDVAGTVNGYPVGKSNQVPGNLTKGSGTNLSATIFGDWSSLHIGLWGGSIITVNPYSKDTSGVIRLTIEQLADIALRHLQSFSVCKDIVTV